MLNASLHRRNIVPAPLNERERTVIRSNLRKAAAECLAATGISKTSVDTLVKKAGIAKGTFYLFYESKEILFFEVLGEFHEKAEREMKAELAAAAHSSEKGKITAEQLSDIILKMCTMTRASFFPALLKNGEVDYLMRKLPQEMLREHLSEDEDRLDILMPYLPDDCCLLTHPERKTAVAQAYQLLFLMLAYFDENPALSPESLSVFINGITQEIFYE